MKQRLGVSGNDRSTPSGTGEMIETLKSRARKVAEREGATSFIDLVQEYADIGYTESATARLVGLDIRTMRRYLRALDAEIQFKKVGDPGWVRWDNPKEYIHKMVATRVERGSFRIIEHQGEKYHLAEWARKTGIRAATIQCRLDRYGWSVHDALTTPAYAIRGARYPHRQRQKRGALNWLFKKEAKS